MKRPRLLVSVVALVVTTTLAVPSCLFDTREAHEPAKQTNACTLESPQKAFVCMTDAIANQKDANYERSLSETFIFSPTLTDSLDQNFTGTDVYTNWDKPTELQALGLMFSDASTSNGGKTIVDFGSPEALINKNTFVRFKSTYSLTVITSNPADTTVYKGVAQIDVRNEGGNWRVTFWDEVETVAGFKTWGFLRGILGLRFRP